MKNKGTLPELRTECYYCKKYWETSIKNNGGFKIKSNVSCVDFKRVAGQWTDMRLSKLW